MRFALRMRRDDGSDSVHARGERSAAAIGSDRFYRRWPMAEQSVRE